MAANISVGSQVWVEDPDAAWVDGEVFRIEGNNAHINTTNGKTVVAEISKIYAKDMEAPPGGVDDMTRLSYLHEPGVLQNLAIRYELNEIYTYTGNILIAINPFQRLPHLYDTHMMDQYKGAPFGELSPHVFAIADAAYRAMMNEGTSNSVLVSGESGAGKTETTKMLMRYLAYMGGRSGTVTEGRTVEQQVLESNPVLEAFGNSKTVRNNNSSRFGKFVELHFDHSGRISGAAVRTYLLERSRVCQINDPERNYHCFYFLCAAPPEDVAKFKVGSPGDFHYLNQSNCLSLDAINDAQEYLDTRRAMEVVGISHEEQDSIFRVVAAILHLGNVNFVKEGTDSSSIKDEKARFHLNTAAELLMCDVKGLESALISRAMHTPEGIIMRALDPAAAVVSRDGIAKTIYSRLFDWLVDKINVSIGQDANRKSLIGVLDIYGFESFKTNSFEQLCINFTNEKLQQHFNQHVFKMEQEEYTREEINWSYIDFVDNKDVLDLIEKKPGGVIAILDEACMFPKSTHETFAQKLYDTFKKHKRFVKPKLSRTSFTIVHYAGDVTYQADYFMDKNKDFVVPEHNELLNASKCSFVSSLFPPLSKESAKSSKFSSIGARFKLQLQALMETLGTTEPRYIRCVKPNNVYKPGVFENMNILNQLRCAGVLEAIRISCAGYPTRKTFDEFILRFGVLAPEFLEESDEKEICRKILDKKGLVGYQIGKTKVFLRAGQMAELDARRGEVLGKAARILQRQMRTYMERKEFLLLRKTSIYVQALWRGRLACKLYEQMRMEAAAVKIQKYQRRRTLWDAYMDLRIQTITVQTAMRGMAARNEFRFRKRTKAATILEAKWRCHRDYTYYKKLQDATLTYQCAWRQRIARKELKKLKMAAKETGALKEAKDKLEKRVEELTWRLQLEKRQRTDLEEAQARDVAKLKEALDEMKSKLEESNAMIIMEREAAQKAIQEAPPVVKETPVLVQDTEKIDSLTAEIEKLKDQLEKEKNSTSAALQTCADLQDKNEKLAKQLEDAGKKVDELQESIQRFEEKLTNLESENQVLRQQALTLTSVNSMNLAQQPQQQPQAQPQAQFQLQPQPQFQQQPQEELQSQQQLQPQPQPQLQMQPQYQLQPMPQAQPIVIQNASENGNIINGAEKPSTLVVPVAPNVDPESDQNPRKYLDEKKKQENKDMLISCISKDIGFLNGRPIAACVIYKCLLHWGSFEVERTSIFDVIIQTMTSSLGAQDSTDPQFYWLSNSAMLLLLLQRTLKASSAAHVSYHRRRTSTSLFGRTSKGTQPSQITGLSPSGRATTGTGGVHQVEAKYPALLFKQQLTGFLERIYGTVRDRMKKEISPLLGLCIQAPRTSRAALAKGARAHHHHPAQAALIAHWQSIVKILDNYLHKMRDNYVPPFIVREMFKQIFSFINVQLFNSLLLRRECCSFSNGEFVKAGLSEIEFWCSDATDVYTGAAWDELKHIRQAVAFLVTQQKPKKILKEITEEICPELSIQQLYRISSMYWDDKYGTHTISNEVMRTMKAMVAEDSNPETSSFLLDDDSSIPFSIDDMSRAKTLQPIDITDVEPPPFLVRQNSGFAFLVQHME